MSCKIVSRMLCFLFAFLWSTQTVSGAPLNARDTGKWVDTWVSMPQLTEYTNVPPPPFNQTGLVFNDSSIRMTIHTSIGGSQIRVRFSNAFGLVDLPITEATVALPSTGNSGDPSIKTHSLQTLTFSGSKNVTIPDGALAVSDPLNFNIEPQSTLTVTVYLANGQQSNAITSHPGSRATSYISFGNYATAQNMTDPSTISIAHWYFLSAVQTYTTPAASAFAIIGDSITDGRGSTTDGNNRWPDLVLARLQKNPSTSSLAVSNQAAGGNRILEDGLGPSVLSRVERDILSHSGVKYTMIFEGVNDIGDADTTPAAQDAIYTSLIEAYTQITTRIHTFNNLPLFAATITPFCAPNANASIQPYSNPLREQTRQRINNWIMNESKFDYVIDFAKIVADPTNSSILNPIYNSGDFLHPNVAGYQAIADQFPLEIFDKFAGGVSGFS